MLVLCQVSVPASVIAHVFGLSQHNVRRIEQGLSCKKIVSAIKSNLQSQLPLLQQTECQSRINHTVLEDLSRAPKPRATQLATIRATDTALTTVLRSAASPVAQTAGVLTD